MPKIAKLFKNGRSQAVRLPLEFRFEGTEVQIERDPFTGNVTLSPVGSQKKSDWADFLELARLTEVPEEFPYRDRSLPDDRDIF
jgi:antitoxin VapB